MTGPFVDPSYLDYQYDDSAKLRIRIETHQRYTVGADDFDATELRHLDPRPGQLALDVGCGPGRLGPILRERGVVYVGLDRSYGMVAEARAADPAGHYLQADARALPIADASVDRAFAIGVLYHVADWPAALREMRRIARPGGRVILSTNGADAMRRLYEVHAEAARELGYVPTPFGGSTFHMDHLAEVQAVFPSAQRFVVESALVFPEVEPVLRFYATNRIDLIEDRPSDDSHGARLIPAVGEKIAAIIVAEGAFRVPKSHGYFVADL